MTPHAPRSPACVFGSCHDRPWGALAIIDRRLGLDGRQAVVRTWPPEAIDLVKDQGWELFDTFSQVRLKYEDPYPLERPGANHPGFVACEADRSREELYRTRRQMEQRHRTAMHEGRHAYDTVRTSSSP